MNVPCPLSNPILCANEPNKLRLPACLPLPGLGCLVLAVL